MAETIVVEYSYNTVKNLKSTRGLRRKLRFDAIRELKGRDRNALKRVLESPDHYYIMRPDEYYMLVNIMLYNAAHGTTSEQLYFDEVFFDAVLDDRIPPLTLLVTDDVDHRQQFEQEQEEEIFKEVYSF